MDNPRSLGVIIARFQTPDLTDAHRYLLSQVVTRAPRVLVLLGCAPVPGTRRDPLEFKLRERMIKDYWEETYRDTPELSVLPMQDCPTDEEWARRVDQLIEVVNIVGPATVFCGPDGAGPTYQKAGGQHPVEVIDAMGAHASKVRHGLTPRYTADFRAGVIYGGERRHLNPFATVDIAAFLKSGQILLGRKPSTGDRWQLPGGFVDTTDQSLEEAARRELHEETSAMTGPMQYVGSWRVDDWRYHGRDECILTTLFACHAHSADIHPNDDLKQLNWFEFATAESVIHPMHATLLRAALQYHRTKDAVPA